MFKQFLYQAVVEWEQNVFDVLLRWLALEFSWNFAGMCRLKLENCHEICVGPH
jgi:hypothetical protein